LEPVPRPRRGLPRLPHCASASITSRRRRTRSGGTPRRWRRPSSASSRSGSPWTTRCGWQPSTRAALGRRRADRHRPQAQGL